ncbi:MAG: FtsX-like permease family protein [Nitrospira sp.]|nr:FtsX-like permease family protein [Nitrospira sp.]
MPHVFLIMARDHLRHRPFRALLTVLGVAIGVAAWLAIRTANSGVYQSFEHSVDSVVGQATVIVEGGAHGIDERLLIPLQRHPAVRAVHPLLKIHASLWTDLPAHQDLEILGVDMIEQANVVLSRSSDQSSLGETLPWAQIVSPQTVFLGEDIARELGISIGTALKVNVKGKPVELIMRGLLEPSSISASRWGRHLMMDIAAAQWVFGEVGRVHEIHLVPALGISQEQLQQEVSALLPSTVMVRPSPQRNGQVEGMLKAFQMNLTMMSGIGLMVGLFLVYNTMAFSVTQHRKEIGILRSLGFERRGIIGLFLVEGGLLGGLGGLLGCGLGLWMAKFLLTLIGETTGDLYGLQSSYIELTWSANMIIEGTVLGLLVSVIGACRPAWEASRLPPVQALALNPSIDTSLNGGRAAVGVVAVALFSALLLSLVPPVEGIPWGGYGAALCLLLGGTAIGPLLFDLIRRIQLGAGNSDRWGLWPSLAADQMTRHVGRTSVTLSAIVIGLSIMVGVGLMIQSFRQTVEWWIEQTMVADIIVAPVSWLGGNEPGRGLPLRLRSVLEETPGVGAVDPYRENKVHVNGKNVALVSRDFTVHAGRSRYLFVEGDSAEILYNAVETNGVIVSEVLAQRLDVQVGHLLRIETPKGLRSFKVQGIFYDYATDGGKVVMDERLYRSLWPDDLTTVFAVYVRPGAALPEIRTLFEQSLSADVPVSTVSNRELRAEILEIFDRTFRVTYVLEGIALAVAILGIVNTLMTAMMERRREFSTLRALGASVAQMKTLVYWEAGYLACLGAVVGVAVGIALSFVLITVINKQSFGWTIPWTVSLEPIVIACVVTGIAILIGAWWPARWAGHQVIASGLRYE